MCFTVHPKHPIAKVAKKDITCYKVVRYDLRPMIFGHGLGKDIPYKLGKLNDRVTLIVHKDVDRYFKVDPEINAGYHSFSSLRDTKRFKRINDYCDPFYIIVKCIIPKGELYYFNPKDHQYVSTNIIIKEIIK